MEKIDAHVFSMGAFGRLSCKIEACASEFFTMRKERRYINFALLYSGRTVDLQKNSGKLEINLIRAPESGKDQCLCIAYEAAVKIANQLTAENDNNAV